MADDIIKSLAGQSDRNETPMAGRGRDDAIESLFFAHYPRVARAAFGIVGDWDLAEQLAQEAFLRLWRRWPLLRDPQAAPAYLERTVVNLARMSIRRRVLERRTLARDNAGRLVGAAADDVDVPADVTLRQAVEALPYRKRACVVLRYLIGMSEAETAQTLGVSVGTVKSQTHKALRQLRAELDESAQVVQRGTAT